jgi:hypothetical protein
LLGKALPRLPPLAFRSQFRRVAVASAIVSIFVEVQVLESIRIRLSTGKASALFALAIVFANIVGKLVSPRLFLPGLCLPGLVSPRLVSPGFVLIAPAEWPGRFTVAFVVAIRPMILRCLVPIFIPRSLPRRVRPSLRITVALARQLPLGGI